MNMLRCFWRSRRLGLTDRKQNRHERDGKFEPASSVEQFISMLCHFLSPPGQLCRHAGRHMPGKSEQGLAAGAYVNLSSCLPPFAFFFISACRAPASPAGIYVLISLSLSAICLAQPSHSLLFQRPILGPHLPTPPPPRISKPLPPWLRRRE